MKVSNGLSALSLVSGGLAASTNSSSSDVAALLANGDLDLGITAEAYEKAVAFVSTLTNAQNVSIITGTDISDSNVTWTAYTSADGGSGLIAEQFKAIGEEFYGMGYSLVDGPVASPAGRVPEGGRNAEGFSFDAYLSGIAMGQAVTGMNSAGVITAGRHFLFNEQETNRMTGERYSSNVDEKTAQEVYLWPFADGVKAGMTAVMCAMNRANGSMTQARLDDMAIRIGHLATAGGSGQASFPYLITPQMALTLRQSQNGGMIWWILNNTYTSTSTGGFDGGGMGDGGGFGSGNDTGSFPGGGGDGGNSSTTMPGGGGIAGIGGGTGMDQSIPDYAANSAVCLVFINADSGEGADRTELYDTKQDTLVTTVAENCNNTVVVINTVGPRLIDAWVEHENITAIVYGGLLGQESVNAIADVLYGDVNPSGKLTYSIAKNESDYANGICTSTDYACDFTEGVYVDYRWFDAKNITPRYEFGYGLSYTTFDHGKVDVKTTNASALTSKYATGVLGLGGQTDLWDDVIQVTTSVSNTGAVEGAEVAQLYVTFPEEAGQPVRVLCGFEKVNVKPGQSAPVTFSLRRRDVSYYDTAAGKWAVASGDYTFAVGSSSRDIKASTNLTL
ncbi:hypothetical protein INS49_010464 [Diaporthe citri]|uniref:uncharacterized protein n=1 Tax=Diaporthe citri TaxID=83186 RepID=UPI001C7FE09D|nr:uncharacterized protein INS49_010464 [Diaporthe citri]KAG6362234.1 hypothetical protein INS49_010464 [Diaporthe citri]